jgi:hypothetical protein
MTFDLSGDHEKAQRLKNGCAFFSCRANYQCAEAAW